MAKSQIIKDIANNSVSLETTLTRALIIASDLGNENISDWVKKELYGYPDARNLPKYRVCKGLLRISYIGGSMQMSNQSLDDELVDESVRDYLRYMCCDGIKFIEESASTDKELRVDFAKFIPFIEHDPMIQIFRFDMLLSKASFQSIIDSVKRVVLDFLLEADKKFGNLDALDISYDEKEIESFNKQINIKIEKLLMIGDNAKITDSNISGENTNIDKKKRKETRHEKD